MNKKFNGILSIAIIAFLLTACTRASSTPPASVATLGIPMVTFSPTSAVMPTAAKAVLTPLAPASPTARPSVSETVEAASTVSTGPQGWLSLSYSPIVRVNKNFTTYIVVSGVNCEYNQSEVEEEQSHIEIAREATGEYFNTLSCEGGKVQHNFTVNVVDEDYENARLAIVDEVAEAYPIVGYSCDHNNNEASFKTATLTDPSGDTFEFVVEGFGVVYKPTIRGLSLESKLLDTDTAWVIESHTSEGYKVFHEVGVCGNGLQIVTVVYLLR